MQDLIDNLRNPDFGVIQILPELKTRKMTPERHRQIKELAIAFAERALPVFEDNVTAVDNERKVALGEDPHEGEHPDCHIHREQLELAKKHINCTEDEDEMKGLAKNYPFGPAGKLGVHPNNLKEMCAQHRHQVHCNHQTRSRPALKYMLGKKEFSEGKINQDQLDMLKKDALDADLGCKVVAAESSASAALASCVGDVAWTCSYAANAAMAAMHALGAQEKAIQEQMLIDLIQSWI